MEQDLLYRFPNGVPCNSLNSIFEDDFVLRAENAAKTRVMFYDTFDWRLFKKSLVLRRTGNEWSVRRLETGDALERLDGDAEPGLVGEIPDGPLKQRIASIVGVRRLLSKGEATVQTTPCRILDDDGKSVARLFVTKVWTGSSDDACEGARGRLLETKSVLLDFHLVLQRVRGYRKDFRRIARKFEEAGLTVGPWQGTFEHIVTAAGKQPGAYSAKPDYRLKAGIRADEATKKILRSTLAVIRANEEGIKGDWDIEFLHDFRTAVRRTRSALNQIPKVFPLDVTERYKKAFAELGARTNQLRDLDVYLLAESEYRAMLPEALRDSISPLFDYMRAQRSQAWNEVVAYLNSPAYTAMMADWATYLSEPVPAQPDAPNAAVPIDELARRRIAKQYRRVIKNGNKILDSDEDELVHQLRIDCKKLRYSLEFYADLFPKKKIGRLVNQLKTLQDELGEFTDLSVQQAYLLHVAQVLPADNQAAKLGLVAIGWLVEKLANAQQAKKSGLAQAFSQFAAAPNRALGRRIFKIK